MKFISNKFISKINKL